MSQLKKSPSIHSTLCMSSLALFLLFKIVNHFSLTFVIGIRSGRSGKTPVTLIPEKCLCFEWNLRKWQHQVARQKHSWWCTQCVSIMVSLVEIEGDKRGSFCSSDIFPIVLLRVVFSISHFRQKVEVEREEIFLARYHRQRLIEGNE